LFTTLIVFHIEKNIVEITAKKAKFTKESLSLKPNKLIAIFLNLKLIFHHNKNIKLTKRIIIVVKKDQFNIRIEYHCPETGEIVIIGKNTNKKTSQNK
jgi:hypothetical protein